MEVEQQALQEQINMLQMQINGTGTEYGRMRQLVNAQLAPLRQQQTQDRAMIDQINTQIQASRGKAAKAEERKAASADLEGTRQAYNESVRELHELLAPLLAKYHELGAGSDRDGRPRPAAATAPRSTTSSARRTRSSPPRN